MAVDAIPLRTAAAAGVALNATVKYNPHLWGSDELRSIFVVRTRELRELLDRLRATPDSSVPQHVLVTGSRGMGKTTLLRRLALAVEDDPELAKSWVPVTFPEEQYTVSTLAELWRNVLDALADTRERQGASTEELGRLDGEIRRIGELPTQEQESAALASLTEWIARNGRRLLLLIDSTDLLLSNLARAAEPKAAQGKNLGQGTRSAKVDGGATPLWRLRSTLTHDPGIFWLGASYQSLETEHAYQDAFWDFFELVELRPLQVAEMRQAMLALARTFGAGRGMTAEDAEREMVRSLDARPERLKALRAITGGNPRTTVMLYELFAAGGADDVHSDLRRLLDTMTPLYKARMEALSDQARKLLAHLMEHWAPISARDLGQVSGIATNTVSGQLGRLEAEGLVEKATLAGTKRAGYQASERLFNVWYLMRYASRRLRQRLTWLVEFMRLWYSGDELTDLARQRASQHSEGRLCRGDQLEFSRALSLALPDGHADHYRLDWAVFRAARRTPDRTRSDLGELFELDGEDREYATADDYLPRFEALDARLALCPHLTEDTRAPWIEAVKSSLSLTLPHKERIADAAKDLTERKYLDVLGVLQDERDRWEQDHGQAAAGAVRDAALAGHFFPDCPDSKLAHNQILGCFGDDPQAIALALHLVVPNHQDTWCEKVVRHALELDSTNAWPWNILGLLLSEQPGRGDEAEAAYRRAAELDPQCALPWNGLGLLLDKQPGRGEEAEATYRRAAELDPQNSWPWFNLGNLLSEQPSRTDEAEAAYRRAAELDPQNARPWFNLGLLLSEQPVRGDEAGAAYRHAIELDPKNAAPWHNLGYLLSKQRGRWKEAEAAYRHANELDPSDARPWHNRANLLSDQLARGDEAEAAYRQAIALDPKDAWPWNGLGNLLDKHPGREEEAEAAYRSAIELNPRYASPWNGLGNLLSRQPGRGQQAEAAYRRAIELDAQGAAPWNGLGDLLSGQTGRDAEAEVAYRQATELDPSQPYPAANLARLFAAGGRRPEADAAYRQAATLAQAADDQGAGTDIPHFNLGFGHAHLLLQAHLWLGNRDLALQALDRLTQAAAAGDRDGFYRLKEQARECQHIGLGPALKGLMEASVWADFLQPFALALGAATLDVKGDALAGAPPELRTLAEEILAELRPAPNVGEGRSAQPIPPLPA